MMKTVPALAALLLLCGCFPRSTIAPRPIKYSLTFEQLAAKELRAANAPHLNQMMIDYGRERAELRALEK